MWISLEPQQSTQLNVYIGKWKSSLHKGKYVSAVFDTTNHHLIISKLAADDFSHLSLDLMLSYLKNCSQRVTINNIFSSRVP